MKKAIDKIPAFSIYPLNESGYYNEEAMAGPYGPYLRSGRQLAAPYRHSLYHIVLFTKGSGTQVIDFEAFGIHPGGIYFLVPGQMHTWDFTGPVDGYVVNFSEHVFSSLTFNPAYLEQFDFLTGSTKDSVIDLKGETLEKIIYYFNQIMDEVTRKDAYSMEMVCVYLMSLFISMSRYKIPAGEKNISGHKQTVLYAFRKLINQWHKEKKLPKDYAEMLHMSPNHLNALCKTHLGLPAGELIRNRILLEARRLLVNADTTVAEIAFHLNFKDNSYFSKFFKKYEGLTPDEFRKKAQKI
jgi:AraC family transcriptional activator of pobA